MVSGDLSLCMTKPALCPVSPVKTQIRLGICRVWSASSLSPWRNLGFSFTQWVHSEDWSDCADVQADQSLHWVHRSFCWFCHAAAHLLQRQNEDWKACMLRNQENLRHFECLIWAALWQNQQNDCAPSEDSDQLGHPPSLIRVFPVRSVGS